MSRFDEIREVRSAPWAFAAIALATTAAYWPALGGGFVWNDLDYVTQPHLRSPGVLWKIWFEVGATEQYYPLLHTAFWLQHQLWGDSFVGYHVANLTLHIIAACLLLVVVRRLAIPGAALAAAIFALHPVCVESVRIHEDDQAPDKWPQKGAKIICPAGGNRPSAYRRRESFNRPPIFFRLFVAKKIGDRSVAHPIRRFVFNHFSIW